MKIMATLLDEGWEKALEGETYTEVNINGKKGTEAYLEAVEEVVNNKIFGSKLDQGQWRVPMSDNRKSMIALTMSNGKTREVIKQIDRLIEVCVQDGDRRAKWIECLADYVRILPLLCSHSDLSTEELSDFQLNCDLFFVKWVELHGVEGITNYIHMLGSGHVSEYMQHWGNLFQHSQQGWEAFNSLLKTFYFWRTQRGGYSRSTTKSRLKPLARWLQRRMVWMEGTTYSEMLDHARSESIVDHDDQHGDNTIAAAPSDLMEATEHEGDDYGSFFV